MTLVEGVHHVTFSDREPPPSGGVLRARLRRDEDADIKEEGVRHVFLEIGSTTVLHPFQLLEGPALPPAPGTMFQRGRLDHFAPGPFPLAALVCGESTLDALTAQQLRELTFLLDCAVRGRVAKRSLDSWLAQLAGRDDRHSAAEALRAAWSRK
jgi:hypothetical protein